MTISGTEDIRLAVLKALAEAGEAAGSSRIGERLAAAGVHLKPRMVRVYLLQLDREGLTRLVSRRRGRELTSGGREELARARVARKVGFIAARVDELGYRMTYGKRHPDGTIIANLSMLTEGDLPAALDLLRPVFARGLAMGNRAALLRPGIALGTCRPPKEGSGLATVCSVTLNGILLHAGIPVTSRFGGLVEMREGRPVRFVELIEYRGTTVDPLETFIRAGMTSVNACARSGAGLIGASFREIPSAALADFRRLRRQMARTGLGGILAVGQPNLPLLEVQVSEGRTGLVIIGGLNPLAALHEAGLRIELASLAGLAPFAAFQPFESLIQGHKA